MGVIGAKRRLIDYIYVSTGGLRGPDSGLVPIFQTVTTGKLIMHRLMSAAGRRL